MKSIVAAVLDTYGGMRVVVTERRSLRAHVRRDELPIIVPNFTVIEPVPWHEIPNVMMRAQLAVDQWIARRGTPNDPVKREIVTMYRLRCLEQDQQSFDPTVIAFT